MKKRQSLKNFNYINFSFNEVVGNTEKVSLTLHAKNYCRQDDGHLSTDGSTVGSDDEWETASGESTGEDLPADIMYLAAAGNISPDAGHTTDEGAENVDREAVQEARNRMNEILSNTNPGNVFVFFQLNQFTSSRSYPKWPHTQYLVRKIFSLDSI